MSTDIDVKLGTAARVFQHWLDSDAEERGGEIHPDQHLSLPYFPPRYQIEALTEAQREARATISSLRHEVETLKADLEVRFALESEYRDSLKEMVEWFEEAPDAIAWDDPTSAIPQSRAAVDRARALISNNKASFRQEVETLLEALKEAREEIASMLADAGCFPLEITNNHVLARIDSAIAAATRREK